MRSGESAREIMLIRLGYDIQFEATAEVPAPGWLIAAVVPKATRLYLWPMGGLPF